MKLLLFKFSTVFALAALAAWAVESTLKAAEIHNAVQQNKLELIKTILKQNPKAINSKQSNGMTPLQLSVQGAKKPVFDLLMKYKPDINMADKNGYTALHWAVMYNRTNMIEPLLNSGADINAADNQFLTPLKRAMQNRRSGNTYIVALMISSVKDVNRKLISGEFPLNFAARHGYADVVQSLLKRKANPNAEDSEGHTPLQLAIVGNHTKVADLLIPKADIRAFRTIGGETLLSWSASRGLVASVVSLIKQNADVGGKNAVGDTPLHSAAWNGHYKVVGTLLDAGADPDALDESGQTALHAAAWNGHLTSVTTLIKGGATPTPKSSRYSPLHGAAWQGHHEVVEALIDFKADINAQEDDGNTPLHKAAWRGHEKVVRILLAKKANASIKESSGLTPLDLAKSARKTAVIALLSK